MSGETPHDQRGEEEVELTGHEAEKLDQISNRQEVIDGEIAQIVSQIQDLEQQKRQLAGEREKVVEKKRDMFTDLVARYNLRPVDTYQFEDGKLIMVEDN